MKNIRFLPVFIALFYAVPLRGQFLHLGLGYNVSFSGYRGLNEVVDGYNSIRPFLDNEMNKFHGAGGMTLQGSAGAGGAIVGFDYSWRRNVNRATGTINGEDFTRYLRYKEDAFGFMVGGAAGGEGAAFSGGLRMEIFNPKVFTRIRNEGEDMPDWEALNNPAASVRLGPVIKLYLGPKEMWPAAFFVSMYYGYSLFKAPMHEADTYLNGNFYDPTEDPPARFVSRNSVFNISVGYGLVFGGE